jgi:hypothetical protein
LDKIKKPKSAGHKKRKQPESIVETKSYLHKTPKWAFRYCDKEKWSVGKSDCRRLIFDKLSPFEGVTWGQIMSASGGKKHGTNSHFVLTGQLSREAQNRLTEIGVSDDQLFSLRLAAKERLWGRLEDGVFYLIWHDPKHEIYPSSV